MVLRLPIGTSEHVDLTCKCRSCLSYILWCWIRKDQLAHPSCLLHLYDSICLTLSPAVKINRRVGKGHLDLHTSTTVPRRTSLHGNTSVTLFFRKLPYLFNAFATVSFVWRTKSAFYVNVGTVLLRVHTLVEPQEWGKCVHMLYLHQKANPEPGIWVESWFGRWSQGNQNRLCWAVIAVGSWGSTLLRTSRGWSRMHPELCLSRDKAAGSQGCIDRDPTEWAIGSLLPSLPPSFLPSFSPSLPSFHSFLPSFFPFF